MKKVSFVIPCYRSEHTLPHVVAEIRTKMQELTQYTYDIFLVNDSSPDNTMGVIRELCDKYDNVRGIGFARNFGQHAALMAGLRHSDGDYVVCLDDDGQTPADEVDKLLDKLEEGFDAVYASYAHKQHSAFRNLGSKVNELMTRMMLDKPADLYISSYFAVKRFVVEDMIRYRAGIAGNKKYYQCTGMPQRTGGRKLRLYSEKTVGIMVQRLYRIFRKTAANCHISGSGLCRDRISLRNLYDH